MNKYQMINLLYLLLFENCIYRFKLAGLNLNGKKDDSSISLPKLITIPQYQLPLNLSYKWKFQNNALLEVEKID